MSPPYIDIDDARGAEYIDSRDLIELREQMSADLSDIIIDGEPESYDGQATELAEGIAAIDELESEGISDWEHGAQLIREDRFEDYARQLAEDIGAIKSDADWPSSYIDWPRAAEALQVDYSHVGFLGHAYLVRS